MKNETYWRMCSKSHVYLLYLAVTFLTRLQCGVLAGNDFVIVTYKLLKIRRVLQTINLKQSIFFHFKLVNFQTFRNGKQKIILKGELEADMKLGR